MSRSDPSGLCDDADALCGDGGGLDEFSSGGDSNLAWASANPLPSECEEDPEMPECHQPHGGAPGGGGGGALGSRGIGSGGGVGDAPLGSGSEGEGAETGQSSEQAGSAVNDVPLTPDWNSLANYGSPGTDGGRAGKGRGSRR